MSVPTSSSASADTVSPPAPIPKGPDSAAQLDALRAEAYTPAEVQKLINDDRAARGREWASVRGELKAKIKAESQATTEALTAEITAQQAIIEQQQAELSQMVSKWSAHNAHTLDQLRQEVSPQQPALFARIEEKLSHLDPLTAEAELDLLSELWFAKPSAKRTAQRPVPPPLHGSMVTPDPISPLDRLRSALGQSPSS